MSAWTWPGHHPASCAAIEESGSLPLPLTRPAVQTPTVVLGGSGSGASEMPDISSTAPGGRKRFPVSPDATMACAGKATIPGQQNTPHPILLKSVVGALPGQSMHGCSGPCIGAVIMLELCIVVASQFAGRLAPTNTSATNANKSCLMTGKTIRNSDCFL